PPLGHAAPPMVGMPAAPEITPHRMDGADPTNAPDFDAPHADELEHYARFMRFMRHYAKMCGPMKQGADEGPLAHLSMAGAQGAPGFGNPAADVGNGSARYQAGPGFPGAGNTFIPGAVSTGHKPEQHQYSRGQEMLNLTPDQIQLLVAHGWIPPQQP